MPLDWLNSSIDAGVSELIARKKRAKAIEVLRSQLQGKSAPSVNVRLQLVDLLIQAGRGLEAVPVLLGLADELARDGFVAKAVAVLKRVDKIEPGRSDVGSRLGVLVQQQRTAASGIRAPQARAPEWGIEEISNEPLPDAFLDLPADAAPTAPAPPAEPLLAWPTSSQEPEVWAPPTKTPWVEWSPETSATEPAPDAVTDADQSVTPPEPPPEQVEAEVAAEVGIPAEAATPGPVVESEATAPVSEGPVEAAAPASPAPIEAQDDQPAESVAAPPAITDAAAVPEPPPPPRPASGQESSVAGRIRGAFRRFLASLETPAAAPSQPSPAVEPEAGPSGGPTAVAEPVAAPAIGAFAVEHTEPMLPPADDATPENEASAAAPDPEPAVAPAIGAFAVEHTEPMLPLADDATPENEACAAAPAPEPVAAPAIGAFAIEHTEPMLPLADDAPPENEASAAEPAPGPVAAPAIGEFAVEHTEPMLPLADDAQPESEAIAAQPAPEPVAAPAIEDFALEPAAPLPVATDATPESEAIATEPAPEAAAAPAGEEFVLEPGEPRLPLAADAPPESAAIAAEPAPDAVATPEDSAKAALAAADAVDVPTEPALGWPAGVDAPEVPAFYAIAAALHEDTELEVVPDDESDLLEVVDDVSDEMFQEQLLDIVEDVLQRPVAPAVQEPAGAPVERTQVLDFAQRLVASPLFGTLSDEELLAVVQGLRLHTFDAGDVVVTEGEPGHSLFIVAAGAVRVFVANPLGHNFPVATLGEGEFFGEISSLSGRPRTATVVAAGSCELLELDKRTLDTIAESHPRVCDVLETYYIQRASSPEAAAIRAVAPNHAGADQKAIEVLEAHFGESRWDPRMRLRLADVLLKAGKHADALPILIGLADELARGGYPEKAVAILKRVEQIQRSHVEEVNLAPLARPRAVAQRQPPPVTPAPAPSPQASAAERRPRQTTDTFFQGWLVEVVRDTVMRLKGPAAAAAGSGVSGYGPGLMASPLFDDFTEDELLVFIQGLRLRSFEPGDVVVSEGEPGSSLFILTTGTVKVFVRNPHGHSVPVSFLREGAFFGEISTLSGRPRSATVTAAAACELLEMDRAALEQIAHTHPRVAQVLDEYSQARSNDPSALRVRGATEPGGH